jgi:hypothetical protein
MTIHIGIAEAKLRPIATIWTPVEPNPLKTGLLPACAAVNTGMPASESSAGECFVS